MPEHANESNKDSSSSKSSSITIPVVTQTINVTFKVASILIVAGFFLLLFEFILYFIVSGPIESSVNRYHSITAFSDKIWINQHALLLALEDKFTGYIDINAVKATIDEYVLLGVEFLSRSMGKNQYLDWLTNIIIKLFASIPDLFTLWIIVTLTWFGKVISIIALFPVWLIIILIGFTDGYVERKINTYKGKRDSEDRIEIWYFLFKSSSYSVFFLYVAIPNAIQAPWLILPSAILSSTFMRGVVASYKKYH
ncbi:DUF4400 domain-containing protein [Vibrio metschnikovii]|nr:DUF4400 domain-containing protein [Vibrio metschnikovii]